jgi:hypothetical protein
MPDTLVQSDRQPPNGTGVALAWPEDEIPDLAEQIASLTLAEAVQLSQYLRDKHDIK